jgi:hypothetical protein
MIMEIDQIAYSDPYKACNSNQVYELAAASLSLAIHLSALVPKPF